ncbi:MAG: branched-chain amino acid ABC transporter permease [Alphaproteobacteria bacterium]|nr:branched-chain amino acid ABC transporter permease [Alphaproteobacteria bacterium]
MRRQLLAIVAFLAAMALVPHLVGSEFWRNWVMMALFYALLGQAWNILGGYGGQFSFGHAAFFGTGAYCSAILHVHYGVNPWIALPAAGMAAGLVGAFIGFLSFRYGLRGSYFALVTLAFAEVLRILANTVPITGKGVGLLIPLDPGAANMQFADRTGYFYLILAFVGLALLLTLWLEHSRFGARLVAVRENEDAARALGVDVFRTKLAAITLSGALAGLGGSYYAQLFLYLDPGIAYGPAISVEALLVPIVGGMGTLFGPLLGSFALHGVSELAKLAFGEAAGLDLALYGVLLVLMVMFMPNGLFGMGRTTLARLLGGGRDA